MVREETPERRRLFCSLRSYLAPSHGVAERGEAASSALPHCRAVVARTISATFGRLCLSQQVIKLLPQTRPSIASIMVESHGEQHNPEMEWPWEEAVVSARVGGAEGNRTPDLCSAIAALSHLSYGPGTSGRHLGGGPESCQGTQWNRASCRAAVLPRLRGKGTRLAGLGQARKPGYDQ